MLSSAAAERRQIVATAEGRGYEVPALSEPRSGERIFRRSAAHPRLEDHTPRLSAVATIFRRSAADWTFRLVMCKRRPSYVLVREDSDRTG